MEYRLVGRVPWTLRRPGACASDAPLRRIAGGPSRLPCDIRNGRSDTMAHLRFAVLGGKDHRLFRKRFNAAPVTLRIVGLGIAIWKISVVPHVKSLAIHPYPCPRARHRGSNLVLAD